MFRARSDTRHTRPLVPALFTGVCDNDNDSFWLQDKSSEPNVARGTFLTRGTRYLAGTRGPLNSITASVEKARRKRRNGSGPICFGETIHSPPSGSLLLCLPQTFQPISTLQIYQHRVEMWIPSESQCIWPEHYYQYASCLEVAVGVNHDSTMFTCGGQVAGTF